MKTASPGVEQVSPDDAVPVWCAGVVPPTGRRQVG
jgi:hypothetical protein